MANRYRFRTALHGHEKDVRGVCAGNFPQGSVVSVSRDITARLWVPNEQDIGFTEGHLMSGHNNFVSCVCVMPPDDKYPHGLIVTGSSDKTILAYTLDSPQPIFKLEGHTNNVCSLAAGKFGTLLSGSWDLTAKVWLNQKCVMTLSGHEAAVWAVAIMPEGGYMITGSADKLIKLWRAGKCQQTFSGHTDCVRAVAVISATEFLSAANDSTIRRWQTSGECTHTYHGHSSYVYSLALLPGGADFVSGGEDRTLRVWSNGQCTQTIPHPTESVWAVCALANGDIVTGASDGVVRVFTTAPERTAEEEVQKTYEAEVAASSIPAQIGDIKTDQLSGPEALLNPGKRDGQTMMIRRENKVEAHQWVAADGRWVKIGDVTGGESGEGVAGGKKTFKGKEYDYVFDVELDEGKAPLKLPFNKGDDPWMAAHNFLQDNDMSPMFLDQVAKFIISQTGDVTIGAPAVQYKDPFSEAHQNTATQSVSYYPKTDYLGFDQANIPAILGKLREFNGKMAESDRINENVLESFEHMMAGQAPSAAQLDNLWKALQWPADVVFPAVDVLRLCIRHVAVCEHFCRPGDGTQLLGLLQRWLSPATPAPVQLLSLRTLANLFRQPSGVALLHAELPAVLGSLAGLPTTAPNKNIQVAAATVLLNVAVLQYSKPGGNPEAKAALAQALAASTDAMTEPEAQFRILVAIGTLCTNDTNAREIVKSSGLVKFTSACRKLTEPKKVADCAKALTQDLLQ